MTTGEGATMRHRQTAGIGRGFHVSGKAGGGKAVPGAGTAPGKAQNVTLRRECWSPFVDACGDWLGDWGRFIVMI